MKESLESTQMPLREKVYRQIKSMIYSGQIEAGNPLSELEISRTIKVGRTPIRESLLQLTGEGLVQYTHNRGFSVAPVTPQDLRDSYELRELIEVRSVEIVCQRGTDEQLAELERIYERFDVWSSPRVLMDDFIYSAQIDREFHTQIVKYSGNRQFMKAWCVHHFVRAGVKLSELQVADPQTAIKEYLNQKTKHKGIVESLRAHKTEQAVEYIRTHIRDAAAESIAVCRDRQMSEDYLWM